MVVLRVNCSQAGAIVIAAAVIHAKCFVAGIGWGCLCIVAKLTWCRLKLIDLI